jgi:uncharacterized membrane protein YbhN (UPF0104 family)
MRLLPQRIDRKTITRLLGSLASLVLLLYLLSKQGWGEILLAIRSIPTATLMAVLVLLVASRVAISARWYSLLRTTDPSIPFREAVRLTLAGLFAANFLPTTIGGDVVRAAGVVRISHDRVASVSSIVVDRLIGMLGMVMVLPIGLMELGSWLQGIPLREGLAGPLFFFGLVGLGVPTGWRARVIRLRRVMQRLVETWRGWLRQPGALAVALGFTWINMLCLFGEVWLLLRAMGEALPLTTIGGLWSLSYFVTLVPVSINGLGLRELSLTYIFSELGGVSVGSALTVALILRTLDMLISLPGAILIPTLPADRPSESRVGP